jgi:hypothetical protein
VSPEYDLTDPDAVAFCPSCGSGYTARVARCEPCDRGLVPRREIEAARAGADAADAAAAGQAGEIATLCRLDDPGRAERLRQALEEAGIPFWADEAPLPVPGLAVPSTEFRVPAGRLEAARRALDALDEPAE